MLAPSGLQSELAANMGVVATSMTNTDHDDLMMVLEKALFLQRASDASSTIRERLATVAQELRTAAAGSAAADCLIRLANDFDEHAMTGEQK